MKPTRTVLAGKNLSDKFTVQNGLKQGDALSLMLFKFPVENIFRKAHENGIYWI
jgi:hypothetical protein